MTRLILNADDFGLTPGINRAIAELHAAGCLTSATLMATGSAFDDAVAIAHANPTLGIGCHIVLTDGAPICPPHTIPTLLGPDRENFRPTLTRFVRDTLLNRIDPADVLREALAQIHRLQQAGLTLTHLDTHKHTHIFPAIARPLLEAAELTDIRAIRNPFEPAWSAGRRTSAADTPPLRRLQLRLLNYLRPRFLAIPAIRDRRILTTDGTLGISATGNLNPATLAAILAAMPPGLWELVTHPGYIDPALDLIPTRLRSSRETERTTLLAAFTPPAATPQLTNYTALKQS